MFYCREQELNKLNKRYDAGKFECVVIYGRRRVGKTALINEFCKNKKTIYFSALNTTSQENLQTLSKAIHLYKTGHATNSPVYRSYEDALDEISNLSLEERVVFVIDEYPYLAKGEESISSRLQHLIDHVWCNSKLYLILCGSSMKRRAERRGLRARSLYISRAWGWDSLPLPFCSFPMYLRCAWEKERLSILRQVIFCPLAWLTKTEC